MSKVCVTSDKAALTTYNYSNKGVLTYKEKNGNYWVVKRSSDDKILKGVDFKEPDLDRFIDTPSGIPNADRGEEKQT
jgi:hypothetical protein